MCWRSAGVYYLPSACRVSASAPVRSLTGKSASVRNLRESGSSRIAVRGRLSVGRYARGQMPKRVTVVR